MTALKNAISALLCLVPLAISCEKSESTPAHQDDKIYFEAWIQTYHPELTGKRVFPGFYVISETEGTGELVGGQDQTPYVRARRTERNLDGKILMTTEEKEARKRGGNFFQQSYYFGPQVLSRVDNGVYAGLDYAISTMKVGGKKSVYVPGWLMTNARYDSEDGYLEAESSGTSCRYDIEIVERVTDIDKWEADSLKRFMKKAYGYSDEQCEKDTLKSGFYKIVNTPPAGPKFSKDTSIYINYVARRLDGQVFDTTIEDTAKRHKLPYETMSFGPISASIKIDDYKNTTIKSDIKVIDGFAFLLNSMGPFETSTGIFHSKYGYTSTGSGYAVPAYCPLMFEISVVAKPE